MSGYNQCSLQTLFSNSFLPDSTTLKANGCYTKVFSSSLAMFYIPEFSGNSVDLTRGASITIFYLNFGITKITNSATTHNPTIHAYMSIPPHHPFPSVIRLNIPIRFPTFSIPLALRSKPLTAPLVTSLSASTSRAISSYARLSCCDFISRDEVKDICSEVFCSRILAIGEIGWVEDDVVAATSCVLEVGSCRFRTVDEVFFWWCRILLLRTI